MELTLDEEAYYLWLTEHYPCVVVLVDHAMYGADSLGDAQRLLMLERAWAHEETYHGT